MAERLDDLRVEEVTKAQTAARAVEKVLESARR
jgi:hypothetical protein